MLYNLKLVLASFTLNTGFVENKALLDLIAVNFSSFDFGQHHKESVKSCEELRKQLDENDLILPDSEYFIHDSIDELKNKVDLKSEQLKMKIDQTTQELIDELDDYGQRCKERQKQSSQQNDEFEVLKKEFRSQNEEAKTRLTNWTNVLNELNVDEAKWKEIKVECDKTIEDLSAKLKQFEKELLKNDEFDYRKFQVDNFVKADIDSLFNKVKKVKKVKVKNN